MVSDLGASRKSVMNPFSIWVRRGEKSDLRQQALETLVEVGLVVFDDQQVVGALLIDQEASRVALGVEGVGGQLPHSSPLSNGTRPRQIAFHRPHLSRD
jgi:hypothetical protein